MVRYLRGTLQKWLQDTQRFLSHNKRLNQVIASRYIIPLIVFIVFFASSLGIGGPAYLSDEIAYLDKAATIAGSTVHFSSSWFAGYSFMISPAFLISSDPYIEWNIILVLNALMWAGSAVLLQYILRKTHPKASKRAVFFATAAAMLYPSWLSMSGYAFSTSGFVLVFMGSLAALLKSNLTHKSWLSVSALLAGYLCWIHPVGVVFAGLLMLALLLKAILKRAYGLALLGLLPAAMAAVYFFVVQPVLNHVMNGGVANDNHYTAGVSGLLHAIPTLHYWLQVGSLLAGSLFFVCIATFGLAAYGSVNVIKQVRNWKQLVEKPEAATMLLAVLAVVGVIVFTALSSGATSKLRVDQWVYGRYIDMYLLPLLGFGLLATWRSKQALKVAGLVVVAGILLSVVTNPHNTLYAYTNKVDLQGLWTIQIPQALRTNNYWVWGVLGAVGIAVCGFMGRAQRKGYLVLLLAPILLAGAGNYMYQFRIAHGYAAPSSLYQYVRSNYTASDCIGFTPGFDKDERFSLYSYYLHGYNLKKMTIDQWQQKDCPGGVYLTYDATPAIAPDLQVKGLEAKTGLYMITPLHGAMAVQPGKDETPVFADHELVGYAQIFN